MKPYLAPVISDKKLWTCICRVFHIWLYHILFNNSPIMALRLFPVLFA